MPQCSAFKCKSRGAHLFPKEPKRRKQWEDALCIENFKASKSSRLCALHFNESDYFGISHYHDRDKPLANFLKKTAVPSKFLDLRVYCPAETENYEMELPDPLPSISVCDLVEQITIKEEIGGPTMNDPPPPFDPESVCRCCLSPSRSLGPLSRSPPWAGAPSVCARVCWECAATLARACRFRERVDAAEAALRRATETQITTEIKSLSTLTTCTKHTYDYVFKFDYRLNETHKPKPRQRKPTLQAKVKSENTMNVFMPHSTEDQEIITHDIKKEPEYSEVKIENLNDYSTIENDATIYNDNLASDNNDATSDNIDSASDNNDVASYNNDTTIKNSEVVTDNNDAATDVKDATTDNDEPLVHVNVIQDSDNPLENEHEVKYLTEEEMRQIFAYGQCSKFKNRRRFKCDMCICVFLSRKVMEKHMEERHGWHAGRYMCGVCQQRFAAPDALAEHCRKHYVSYCCRRCGLTDRRLGSMMLHVREHAPRQHLPGKCSAAPTEPNLRRECGVCYETIYFPMTRHYATCHLPTERPRCRLCDKELTSQYCYVKHMKTVHMPKRYKCTFCNNLFSRKNLRQLHIDRIHMRTKKHQCTECGKAFSSMLVLKMHSRRVHEKVNRKLCMYCGKSLENLTQLTEHLRTHTGERPYQCAHCHSAFAQRSNIISHIKSVHKELTRHTPSN